MVVRLCFGLIEGRREGEAGGACVCDAAMCGQQQQQTRDNDFGLRAAPVPPKSAGQYKRTAVFVVVVGRVLWFGCWVLWAALRPSQNITFKRKATKEPRKKEAISSSG